MAEFLKMLGSFWLPAAIFGSVWLIVRNANSLALALKDAPIIRSLKIYGVEITLDPKALDALEERETRIFRELATKTERAATRAANALSIKEHLKDAASEIIKSLSDNKKEIGPGKCRFTIHTEDILFKNHLYQLTPYFSPSSGSSDGHGRRFSSRYGIIGLASRSGVSQGVCKAFQGGKDEIEDLKIRWSMTDEEASRAKERPSCLAIAIRSISPVRLVAILYCDASEPDFWGNTDQEANDFARKCEQLGSVEHIRKAMQEFVGFADQLRLDLDLTKL